MRTAEEADAEAEAASDSVEEAEKMTHGSEWDFTR